MNISLNVIYKKLLIISLCVLWYSNEAWTHPMPYSLVGISVMDKSIKITLEVPSNILESVLHDEFNGFCFENSSDYKSTVSTYFKEHFNIVSSKGTRQLLEIDSITIIEKNIGLPDYFQELYLEYNLNIKNDFDVKNFLMLYDGIIHHDGSHYAILTLNRGLFNDINSENPQILGVFKRNSNQYVDPIQVKINDVSKWTAFRKMVSLGQYHIKTGLDHLLFVILLVLIAPVLIDSKTRVDFGGWKHFAKRILKIVTAFTIGHSLTLLIFTTNDLNSFSKPIEIGIALTIIITGIHAIKPIFYGKELFLTFVFGLIHGSAFGITLNEWELTLSQKLFSLLGFNIGIELMQILIVFSCLPIVFLSKYPFFKIIRLSVASVTIFISIFWMIERINEAPNEVTKFVESVMSGNY